MSRKPVRPQPDRRAGRGSTTSVTSTRRVGLVLAIAALAILVVGALFASGSDARKSRPRTGTIPRTSTTTASATVAAAAPTTRASTAGIPQLTLRPRSAATSTPAVTRAPSPTTRVSSTLLSNRADPRLRAIGFRSQSRLDDHYAKHGREFGSISKAQYLAMAQDLRDAPLSKTVIEANQANGSISRFNRSTGGFIAFNDDLTIRTFFRPDDGEAYFRRAASRSS